MDNVEVSRIQLKNYQRTFTEHPHTHDPIKHITIATQQSVYTGDLITIVIM